MVTVNVPRNAAAIAEWLGEIPSAPGVFFLWAGSGAPLFARTNSLRKRLGRLLAGSSGRGLNLQGVAEKLEYQAAGSRLESRFIQLDIARARLGGDYRKTIRLRLPPYLKLAMSNEFPRVRTASTLSRSGRGLYVGPFRNRATAAQFESGFLDLFQLRRCHEDLIPSADHPGCIYGEMGRCLRPCQAAVSPDEYRTEADRVGEYLRSGGRSLLAPALAERERLSEAMDFEGAARAHERVQKIEESLVWRDEMARSVDDLHAIAIVPGYGARAVELGWLRGGYWHGFRSLDFQTGEDGRPVSLDSRLREIAAGIPAARECPPTVRTEELAVLSRWFYASWRDGEMIVIDDWDKMPWRKIVNAVSRVAGR